MKRKNDMKKIGFLILLFVISQCITAQHCARFIVESNNPSYGTVNDFFLWDDEPEGEDYYKDIQLNVKSVANGYYFDHWGGVLVENPTSSSTTVKIRKKIKVCWGSMPCCDNKWIAYFYRYVTVTTSCTNGSVSGAGGSNYKNGQSLTLTVTPNEQHYFEKWSDGNTQNPRSITVYQQDEHYSAICSRYYTISANGINGTVTGVKENNGSYKAGEQVILSAIPDDGYYFAGWSDGNTDNPRIFNVTEDVTLTALFNKGFFVSTTATNGKVVGGGWYDENATCILVAVPDDGYYFKWWNDGNRDNPRYIKVTQPMSFEAIFATGLLCDVEAEHGRVSGTGAFAPGTLVTLTPTADDGYYFEKWGDGNTDNPRSFTITTDTAFKAIFTKYIHVTCTAGEHGTVQGEGIYKRDSIVVVTALPEHGYYLDKWEDGTWTNPLRFIAKTDTSFHATFEKCFVVSGIHKNGQIVGKGFYRQQALVVLEAVGNEGYYFTHWEGGSKHNIRTFVITKDTSVTAYFQPYFNVTSNITNGEIHGLGHYRFGDTCHLSVSANEGYYFVRWENGSTYQNRSLVVTNDVEVSCDFDKYCELMTQAENGHISANGRFFQIGDTCVMYPIADDEYHFVKWNDGRKDNPRIIRIETDTTFNAVFEKKYLYLNDDDVEVYSTHGIKVTKDKKNLLPGTYILKKGDKTQVVFVK